MTRPVFVSSSIMAALVAAGPAGGLLQAVTMDGAILILGATGDDGTTIVKGRPAPGWAEKGAPALMPWRRLPAAALDQVKAASYRLKDVDLGLQITLDDPGSTACVLFDGYGTFALVVDNSAPERAVLGLVEIAEPLQRPTANDDPLADRTVVLIGAGSLGSHLARALAEWGIRRIIILDKDWLTAGNLPLHACPPGFVGAAKARAVATDLERIVGTNPFGMRLDVLKCPEFVRELIAEANLVVVAVDDVTAREWLNHTVVTLGVPTLFAALFRRGTIGEALLVSPGGPCLRCSRRILPIVSSPNETKSPSAYRNGLLTSIQGLSSLAATMAVEVLTTGTPGGSAQLRPLALWSPIAQDEIGSPFFQFDLPNQTNWVSLQTDPTCVVCRSARDTVSDADHERMRLRLGVDPMSGVGP